MWKAWRPGDLCWRCHRPIWRKADGQAGHRRARALGGTTADLAPEHKDCNERAGGRLGAALRYGRVRRRFREIPAGRREW